MQRRKVSQNKICTYLVRDRILIEKDNTSLLYKNKYYSFWYRFAFNYNTITNFYTARKLGESYAN